MSALFDSKTKTSLWIIPLAITIGVTLKIVEYLINN